LARTVKTRHSEIKEDSEGNFLLSNGDGARFSVSEIAPRSVGFCEATRAQSVSVLRFFCHTQLGTRIHPAGLLWTSDQIVAVAAIYTIHREHKRRKIMPSVGFEPSIQSIGRPQT